MFLRAQGLRGRELGVKVSPRCLNLGSDEKLIVNDAAKPFFIAESFAVIPATDITVMIQTILTTNNLPESQPTSHGSTKSLGESKVLWSPLLPFSDVQKHLSEITEKSYIPFKYHLRVVFLYLSNRQLLCVECSSYKISLGDSCCLKLYCTNIQYMVFYHACYLSWCV
ncbi:hypothetical protein DFP77_1164 [Marinomonas foliarum]|uniref:Uncharacterized protein n=1 Tax=Marinomonas foliarum TaxID=491950 RepID=A0A369A0I9_9GAMM|nr:hypothetical protein DFP77_1164 [Marinomonas foliarum]